MLRVSSGFAVVKPARLATLSCSRTGPCSSKAARTGSRTGPCGSKTGPSGSGTKRTDSDTKMRASGCKTALLVLAKQNTLLKTDARRIDRILST